MAIRWRLRDRVYFAALCVAGAVVEGGYWCKERSTRAWRALIQTTHRLQ